MRVVLGLVGAALSAWREENPEMNGLPEVTRREVRRRFGPGFLVAAAFIGPGTVTTASLAGAQHGFALAWARGAPGRRLLILKLDYDLK